MRKKFSLPMTLSHLMEKVSQDHWVAHSLDFDIVEVGKSKDEAWENLMLAVKSYVEFGLSKGWDDFILFDAPEELQRQFREDRAVTMMPPLQIANVERAVAVITHASGMYENQAETK